MSDKNPNSWFYIVISYTSLFVVPQMQEWSCRKSSLQLEQEREVLRMRQSSCTNDLAAVTWDGTGEDCPEWHTWSRVWKLYSYIRFLKSVIFSNHPFPTSWNLFLRSARKFVLDSGRTGLLDAGEVPLWPGCETVPFLSTRRFSCPTKGWLADWSKAHTF